MSVGTKSLVTKVDGCTASTVTNLNAARFAAIHNSLNTCIADKFATCAALPTACNNTGRLVYIESICSYRYSDGVSWSTDFDSTLVETRNLYTWGANRDSYNGSSTSVLGDPSITTSRVSPGTTAGGGTNWCHIGDGASYFHRVGIKTDGTLWVWGKNFQGALGDGSTNERTSPVTVAGGGTTWKFASAGWRFTFATKTDGTLWTWGTNTDGILGDPATTSRSSPGTTAGGGTDWNKIATGQYIGAAIKTDGTLWTWGRNNNGQLGDGSVTCRSSPGTVAGGGTTWCQINSKLSTVAGIKTDNTLWAWGLNSSGQVGDNTMTTRSSPVTVAGGGTNWCGVSTGCIHTAGVKTDGTLWTWGQNNRLGFGSTNGILGDGTTNNRCSPGTNAGGGTTWCFVSGGGSNSAAIKTDGTLWSWGSNDRGELGVGDTTNRISPTSVIGGINTWFAVNAATANMESIPWCYEDHMAGITLTTSGFNAAA